MKKIGLLSDTHGYLDPMLFKYFEDCDEVWHAGDIGSLDVTDQLAAFKPLRAVFGNIDDYRIRTEFAEMLHFTLEDVKVMIMHIGGKPRTYPASVRNLLTTYLPDVFICGHTHICRAEMDPALKMLYLNPGACGIQGFHNIRTAMRFKLLEGKVIDLEVIELGKRGTIPPP